VNLARQLAVRCAALERDGLEQAAAERQTFAELLNSANAASANPDSLYEEFLRAYAPGLRRRRGVYATPPQIVGAQVRLAADVLEKYLGCASGFADERVLLVDPAAGTGVYPMAVKDRVPPERLRLFEPMIGAACTARARGLHVEERDALAGPVTLDAPIVVCLGNPPYQRGRVVDPKGGFVRRLLLDDFRDSAAGLHLKNLYNDYVYFWRWALWHVFEQRAGPGVVSFISAASYLGGPGFGGMRRMLRRVLDELWIIDLQGDHLAARKSDNVFGIRTPVAIGMGLRYAEPRPDQPATVRYTLLAGSQADKLADLDRVRSVGELPWQKPRQVWQAPFVPALQTAYQTWPGLTELFPWQVSGAQLKRMWPIGPTPELLRERWQQLLELPAMDRARAFRETRDRHLQSTPASLCDPSCRLSPLGGLPPGSPPVEPVRYAYRSFDRQWVLPDARLGDFMRPALWRVAGPAQIFVTSLLTNLLGPGPAAVATALVPDLDHFRGSFGARAVIPLWRDAAAARPNLADGLLERVARVLQMDVSARMVLAYCYALLGTRSYVARLANELRTPGPRVPLTADPSLFARTARLGEQLLGLHTYSCTPAGKTRCIAPVGRGYPSSVSYDALGQTLRVGAGVFGPITPAAWSYSVSGLRIVPSWLRRRIAPARRTGSVLDEIRPHTWTSDLTRELLELVWLLESTIDLEPALDDALEKAVRSAPPAGYWLRT
jgi:hypothetical protein